MEEAGLGPKQKLIGRAVDLAMYMEKTPDNQRRISSIAMVNKLKQTRSTRRAPHKDGSL